MPGTTIEQAVRNAIEAELAAARFYSLLAASTQDQEGRRFLEQMAEDERRHAREIERIAKMLEVGPLPEQADGKVSVIETLPEWKYADDLTLEQAMDVALDAERCAALYYDALADHFEEPAKSFFLSLSKTEERHAEALERRKLKTASD